MPSSVREMLAEANAALPRLNPAEVRDMIAKENVLIVDVRDAPGSLPAASSKAPSTCHAVWWNFGPSRKAHSTIRRFRKTRLS
jgi:hypothetical protein